jgi:hypothetical protein
VASHAVFAIREAPNVALPADDPPRRGEHGPQALGLPPHRRAFVHEDDHGAAGGEHHDRGQDERGRLPDGQQEPTAHQPAP